MTVVSHRNFSSAPPAAAPTIDMPGLSRMLGIERESATSSRHTSPARRVEYVQGLMDGFGFPPPLPHLEKGADGNELIKTISYRKSRWLRTAVDAWMNGTPAPQAAGAGEDQAAKEAANRLDQAAELLAS